MPGRKKPRPGISPDLTVGKTLFFISLKPTSKAQTKEG